MKALRILSIAAAAAAFLAAMAAFAAARLSGVTAIYRDHAIATVEVEGLSDAAAEDLRQSFADRAGMRGAAIARSAGDPGNWLLRLQFRAESPEDAGRRLADWSREKPAGAQIEILRASFYPLRVARPGSGDIVLGAQQPVVIR